MRKKFHIAIFVIALIFLFLGSFQVSFADTTPFRSARIITTDGKPQYTNLENCSVTDGATCDRATSEHYANLYFRDFGNYDEFGIPQGSKISKIRIRVTGKTSHGLYVGLSYSKKFIVNCQSPSELWRTGQLGGDVIKTQLFVGDVVDKFILGNVGGYCLDFSNFENQNFILRINYSSPNTWSANIDNFEIAFDYNPPLIPTPTPTPTQTPTPTPIPGPEPFLDLPWDYEGKGLSFSEAALSINSFFDHEYPLLSFYNAEKQCPPAPIEIPRLTTTFRGDRLSEPESFYHCHDGYDYGKKAKANLGDPVLAAADGCASYSYFSAGGHTIKIDHGNYYQTRYLHLQDTKELVTKDTASCVKVNARQQIGLVGSTGNSTGAHIHFGVVEDKNKDGNFDDNIPDGVTDPFGWQSKEQDPWEMFSFSYNGMDRTGSRSYYLWKKKLDSLDSTLTANGAVFNSGRYEVEFPEDATETELNLNIQSAPIVETLGNLVSIGTTLDISAYDLLGNLIASFEKLFDITVDFSPFDLTRYDINTLSFYSSTDGITWTKEPTIIDMVAQTATAQVDHLTQFALMAERKDTIPPTTTAVLDGQQGQSNWFRSDVSLTLNPEDNENGLGVDYTLFKIDGKDWETYTSPLVFTEEGHHKLEFYSVDKDENIEEVKTIEFDIDKTVPEAKIFIDQDKQDLVVEGIDQNQTTVDRQDNIQTRKKHHAIYTVTDLAGNTIKLDVKDRDKEKKDKFKIYSLQYNQDAPVNQPDNHYYVRYKGEKGQLNVREQNFKIEKEIKIRIKYDKKKNQSAITTKLHDQEKTKETRDGLTLLQLTTEKGTLNYRY